MADLKQDIVDSMKEIFEYNRDQLLKRLEIQEQKERLRELSKYEHEIDKRSNKMDYNKLNKLV